MRDRYELRKTAAQYGTRNPRPPITAESVWAWGAVGVGVVVMLASGWILGELVEEWGWGWTILCLVLAWGAGAATWRAGQSIEHFGGRRGEN